MYINGFIRKMEKLRNNQEFIKLCRDLRQKGIMRTKEEYFKIMMNITKVYFKIYFTS